MEKKNNDTTEGVISRPPIIAVMGHIDHGKSTLLDYIRKSNVVAGESGGITQHISAYEVEHKTKDGQIQRITFLDTPGHEAFSSMRSRGAELADIVILVVSAEDGVKKQTLEALEAIKASKKPYVVAINKIDRPEANVEKTKSELAENEIYLEGFGGNIPFTPLSAKTGAGVPELMDILLLVAEMEELKGDKNKPAEGIVVESNVDPRKGISATLVITDGTLKKGQFIVVGETYSPIRIFEDFTGKKIDEAFFSSPVVITGFSDIPQSGVSFETVGSKKEAEKIIKQRKEVSLQSQGNQQITPNDEKCYLPLIIKSDTLGTLEAVEKEISKLKHDNIEIKVVYRGVGDVTERDIKKALADKEKTTIIGFRTGIDKEARSCIEKEKIRIETFAIIYNISDYLEKLLKECAPKVKTEEILGKAKIIRVFSKTKDKQVVGGRVLEGVLSLNSEVKINRRDFELGLGKITELQKQKVKIEEVVTEDEFGVMIESKAEIAQGDIIEAFRIVEK